MSKITFSDKGIKILQKNPNIKRVSEYAFFIIKFIYYYTNEQIK